jgi:hypothetical protein
LRFAAFKQAKTSPSLGTLSRSVTPLLRLGDFDGV